MPKLSIRHPQVNSENSTATPVDPTQRRYKILRIAMRKIAWPMMTLREEAEAQGTDFDEAVARQLANDPDYLKRIAETALEEIIAVDTAAPVVDPIYAAIEAHRAAYAAYDGAAEAPDDENEEAFRELDRASQHLMRAEASTLASLIALLRYVAPLLQEAGAPGLPIEVPFAGRWSAAFGTFCANVANSLAAIVAKAALPPDVDDVANAIIEATATLIEDFDVARRAARAAIVAIARRPNPHRGARQTRQTAIWPLRKSSNSRIKKRPMKIKGRGSLAHCTAQGICAVTEDSRARSLSEYSESSILTRILFRESLHGESNFAGPVSRRLPKRIPFSDTRRFSIVRTGS
jgi:hypothetical protein